MAMSTLAGMRNNRNLICSVCQDVYRSPRFLPCHHTFCLRCIEGLASTHGQRFICPQCRKPVEVPREGPLGFQVNFYLDEDQLELARKGPGNTICSVHIKDMEPLVFYCKPCDKAICIRCKLTEHDDHKSEDLSKAAERCMQPLKDSKNRLEETIRFLTKKADQAHEDLKAAKQKSPALKEQVKYQRDVLKARIDEAAEIVLKEVEATNTETEQELSETASSIQRKLDSLTQLRQRVHHALEGADADKVCTEREMREGAGNAEALQAATEVVPTLTTRQVLHSDVEIADDIIFQHLGKPKKESIPSQPPTEVITVIAKAGLGKPFRRIHSLNPMENAIRVNIGGMPPNFQEASINNFDKNASSLQRETVSTENTGKCSLKTYEQNRCFRTSYKLFENIQILPKADTMFKAVNAVKQGISIISAISPKREDSGNVDTSPREIKTFTTGTLIAFEASADGTKFAMVEEIKGPNSLAKRVVRLYSTQHEEAVASFLPPVDSFMPMDICFWHKENEDLLLIADFNNDSIHVVNTTDNKMEFVRYLASGSGHLVRPTALNVDSEGKVWIGCDNGWVLQSEIKPETSRKADDAEMAESSSEADAASTAPLTSSVLSLYDDGILPSVSSASSSSTTRRINNQVMRMERNGAGRVRNSPY